MKDLRDGDALFFCLGFDFLAHSAVPDQCNIHSFTGERRSLFCLFKYLFREFPGKKFLMQPFDRRPDIVLVYDERQVDL